MIGVSSNGRGSGKSPTGSCNSWSGNLPRFPVVWHQKSPAGSARGRPGARTDSPSAALRSLDTIERVSGPSRRRDRIRGCRRRLDTDCRGVRSLIPGAISVSPNSLDTPRLGVEGSPTRTKCRSSAGAPAEASCCRPQPRQRRALRVPECVQGVLGRHASAIRDRPLDRLKKDRRPPESQTIRGP